MKSLTPCSSVCMPYADSRVVINPIQTWLCMLIGGPTTPHVARISCSMPGKPLPANRYSRVEEFLHVCRADYMSPGCGRQTSLQPHNCECDNLISPSSLERLWLSEVLSELAPSSTESLFSMPRLMPTRLSRLFRKPA